MKTEYKINIMGEDMVILSDECPDHVRAVEQLINTQMAGQDVGGVDQSALLATSLKLADALIKERSRHTKLKEKIRTRSSALLQQLDAKFAH